MEECLQEAIPAYLFGLEGIIRSVKERFDNNRQPELD